MRIRPTTIPCYSPRVVVDARHRNIRRRVFDIGVCMRGDQQTGDQQ